MVAVFAEVWRVLRDDGVLWLNVGDSYAANRPGGQPIPTNTGNKNGHNGAVMVPPGLKPKDLVGIPWRLAFALQDAGWYLRSDVIWHKPNPMPESVTDRPTKAHEYVFLLTKSARYYYDAQAIAEASTYPDDNRKARSNVDQKRMPTNEIAGVRPGSATYATRNRRSVWTIATEPSSVPHYAMMPTALAEVCILAGTSARGVCPACGAPWVRVVEREKANMAERYVRGEPKRHGTAGAAASGASNVGRYSGAIRAIGWRPSCTCDAGDPIPATVLDPFAGTGTTIRVAVGLGRAGIGIELNPESVMWANRLLAQTQPALIAI